MKSQIKFKSLKGTKTSGTTSSVDNEIITGPAGSSMDSIVFPGAGQIQSLDPSGVTIINPLGISALYYSGERLNMNSTTGFIPFNPLITQSIINITDNTDITGEIQDSDYDFFNKTIIIGDLFVGATLTLTFGVDNPLVTADGDSDVKSIVFNASGQSMTFIFDKIKTQWYIKDSGFHSIG